MLTIADILRGVDRAYLASVREGDWTFRRVIHDSRAVRAGDLFVALRGDRDGHDFVLDAFHRGARGALVDRVPTVELGGRRFRGAFGYVVVPDTLLALQQLAAYWLAKHPMRVVGVTGSVGKTTTKEMVAAVLAQRYSVLKNEKNLNNEIGLPLTALRTERHHQVAVLEMGMYALGEIAALCDIARPNIGVVTNVGPSHLERLGSLGRIAEAKSELVRALPADGVAVLNGDDALVRAMSQKTRAKTLLFGLSEDCDLRATNVQTHGLSGNTFDVCFGDDVTQVSNQMPGFHSVYACLAAVAVGLCSGLNWSEIKAGLASGSSDLRIAPVLGRSGSTIIDDTYNASPASVGAALELLAQLPGRRVAILGDMFELGDYEEDGHREVGRCAAACVDSLIVVGRRARWIGEEAMLSGLSSVTFADDKDRVDVDLQRDDYVLVKGSRGMRMEEIVERLRAPNVTVS